MKLSKIWALCREQRRFIVYNLPGGQWISDGYATYPLMELPELSEESIYTIVDIPKDKRTEFVFERRTSEPFGISFADAVEKEYELKRVPLTLVVHGTTVLPFESRYGVLFVDKRYLIPFGDGVTLWERFFPESKRSYIAVKRGMLLEGIILPEDIATPALADMLVNIGEAIAGVAKAEKSGEPEQVGMDV